MLLEQEEAVAGFGVSTHGSRGGWRERAVSNEALTATESHILAEQSADLRHKSCPMFNPKPMRRIQAVPGAAFASVASTTGAQDDLLATPYRLCGSYVPKPPLQLATARSIPTLPRREARRLLPRQCLSAWYC